MPTLQMRQLKRMSLNQNESLRRMTSNTAPYITTSPKSRSSDLL